MRVALDPDPDDVDLLLAHLPSLGERNFVVTTRRAHLLPRQREAVERILAVVPDAIVIVCREPYDAVCWPQARTVACTYGDDALAFAGLRRRAVGDRRAAGPPPGPARRCAPALTGSMRWSSAISASAIARRRARRARRPRRLRARLGKLARADTLSGLRRHALRCGLDHQGLRLDGRAGASRARQARARRAVGRSDSRMARGTLSRRHAAPHPGAHGGFRSGADFRTLFGEHVETFALARPLVAAPGERVDLQRPGVSRVGRIARAARGRSRWHRWSKANCARSAARRVSFVPRRSARSDSGDRARCVARARARDACTTRRRRWPAAWPVTPGCSPTRATLRGSASGTSGRASARPSPLPPALAPAATSKQAADPVLRRGLGWALKTSDDNSCGARMSRADLRPHRLHRHVHLGRSAARPQRRRADQRGALSAATTCARCGPALCDAAVEAFGA